MMEISNGQLQRLAAGTVRPGEIYRMELTPKEGVKPKNEGDTSRNKYFVVMGVTEDGCLIGFVLINTAINPYISQQARDGYYVLSVADYPFLGKDRYVCCGELKQIETADFFRRFRNGAVAALKPDHLEAVRGIVALSSDADAATLRGYGII